MTPDSVQDIDFLPAQCRRDHVRRRSQPWRLVVVTTFAVLLAAAAYSQHCRKQRVVEQLAAIAPQYEQVLAQRSQLAQIQSRLLSARTRAELLAYLRYPWPRTQLLATLLPALPDEITLDQLQIIRREPPRPAGVEQLGRAERRAAAEQQQKLPPAARDLEQLRQQCDRAETVVLLSGTTTDIAALHAYLGDLGDTQLIAKAELDSIDRDENEQTTTQQFSATLIVRPGYGLPNGPSGPAEAEVTDGEPSPLTMQTLPYFDQTGNGSHEG